MIAFPKVGIVVVAALGVGFVFGLAILDSWLGGVLVSHFFWPGD